jgi:hypothetical protein
MIWLVNEPGNEDGAPAGLVIKERMGRLEVDDAGDWKIRRTLPRRIPHCAWADIRLYLANGCNLAEPGKGESLSEDERDMISPMLSDKQIQLMMLDAQKDLLVQEQATAGLPGIQGQPWVKAGSGEKTQTETVSAGSARPASPDRESKIAEIAQVIRGMRLDLSDGEIRERLRERGHNLPLILQAFKSLEWRGEISGSDMSKVRED